MPTNIAFSTMDLIPSLSKSMPELTRGLSAALNPKMSSAGAIGGGLFGKTLMRSFAPLALAAGAVAVGRAAFGALKGAVSGAANLEQSLGAVEAVFKGSAGQLLGWADDSVSRVGLAKSEYADLGTLIGAQFKNAGVPMDELAPKTDGVITLGADLAAQFGGSTSDAVSALSSALRGETDPVEKYGVSLTAAAVSAEAARLGFAKVGGEFDLAARQAATLSLIQAQSVDAMGTFSRESDTLANKQQRLGALWRDGAARIGTALLPAVSGMAGWLIAALGPALDGAERLITSATAGATSVYSVLRDGDFTSFGGVQEDSAFVGFLFGIRDAAIAVRDFIGGLQLPSLVPPGEGATFQALPGLAGLMAVLAATGAAFAPYLPQLGTALSGLLGPALQIATSISPVGLVLRGLMPILPAIAALAGQLAALLAGELAPTMGVFMGLTTAFVSLLSGQAAVVWPMLGAGIVTLVGLYVSELLPVILELWGAVLPLAATLLTGLLPSLTQILGAVTTALVSIGGLVVAIAPVIAVVVAVLVPTISALLPVITTVFGVVADVITAALSVVEGVIAVATGILTGNWSQVWFGLGTILSGVWALITSIISGAVAVVRSLIDAGLSNITRLWRAALDGLQALFGGLWTGITGAIQAGATALLDYVGGIGERLLDALGDFGSMLTGVGRNMIEGLIGGVKDAMARLAESLLAPIKNSVENVKSFLGIHSPSRLMRAEGQEWAAAARTSYEPVPAPPAGGIRAQVREALREDREGQTFEIHGVRDGRATAAAIARSKGRPDAEVRSIFDAPRKTA
jgi:hypothetical protein